MDKCTNCGSNNIKKDISVGRAGLRYTMVGVLHVEVFHADLCKDCGNVMLHVKETDKNWI